MNLFIRIQEYMRARRKHRQRARWERSFKRDNGVRIEHGRVLFFGRELIPAVAEALGAGRNLYGELTIHADGVDGYYTVAGEGLARGSDRGCLMIHAHSGIEWDDVSAMSSWAIGVVAKAREIAWRNHLHRIDVEREIAAANAAANEWTTTEVSE